jgi:hypothetical protein
MASRLRRQRFQVLRDMIGDGDEKVSILDIGGRARYWRTMLEGEDGAELGERIDVTLLNLDPPREADADYPRLVGDARAMPELSDGQFDIVFSNSTIEHVGGWDDQLKMATEVKRVGRRYYVQTPNRYFPIEPHFVFPLFQFLPVAARASLVQRFSLGWMPKQPEREEALSSVRGIRLLTRSQLARLFPEATIAEEKVAGLVKSYVAYTP